MKSAQRKSIWNLNFHADTAAIFSQMNETLNLQHHGIFGVIWRHIKVFKKCFHRKSVCPVIWWATGKARFLKKVTKAFHGNFKRKLCSSLCYRTLSVRNCFCVCICLIFRFVYLAYYCFCIMLFSLSHLSTVNIFCCSCYMPRIYVKSPMLCMRNVYCLLFSKTP